MAAEGAPAPRLGVAFLAYNEEALIARTVAEAVRSLSAVPGLDWRVVVVNDGSRDRTGEIAEGLARDDGRVSVVHHDGNKGYAVATETALRRTPGQVVMVVDGDGQHTMADAPRFLEAIDGGADVVFGWKKERHDPFLRLVLSRGLNLLSRWILGSPLHDINGGCRAFRREVARAIEIRHRINFVGDEIFARCRIAGWRVAEVVVRHFPREAGQSIHRPWKMAGTVARVIRYLFELRAEMRRAADSASPPPHGGDEPRRGTSPASPRSFDPGEADRGTSAPADPALPTAGGRPSVDGSGSPKPPGRSPGPPRR